MDQEQMMQLMMMMNPEMAQMMQLLNAMNAPAAAEKPKKKITAYQRRYKAAFKKLEKRYKLKSGKWKKGGFKAAVKAAHAQAKKSKK